MATAQTLVTSGQLGSLLQGARKARGYTQAQLASQLGISQNRLSELEREPEHMNVAQLLAVCGQLGLRLSVAAAEAPEAVATSPAQW